MFNFFVAPQPFLVLEFAPYSLEKGMVQSRFLTEYLMYISLSPFLPASLSPSLPLSLSPPPSLSLPPVLHQYPRELKYTVDHMMSWTVQMSVALEFIHSEKMLHRDIKPSKCVCVCVHSFPFSLTSLPSPSFPLSLPSLSLPSLSLPSVSSCSKTGASSSCVISELPVNWSTLSPTQWGHRGTWPQRSSEVR